MKINQSTSNPTQSNEAAGAKKTGKANAAATNAAESKSGDAKASVGASADSVKADISSRGKEFARAKEVAANAPDVREEKVAELKRRIAEGKYKVDANAVADKLVNEHLTTSGMS